MITQIAYFSVGLILAGFLLILMEKRDKLENDADRFHFALILVIGCGLFWPIVGSATAIMLLAEWVA